MSRHLRKRSLILAGHDTSVALEPAFWSVLEDMIAHQNVTLVQLVTQVDATRAPDQSLASALRVTALQWLQQQVGTNPQTRL
ncbi:ribbon-helix-helix domain-containing protein [Acetobacter sp. LMG 32666]|uniref:ribbon-helix-helix domain-containing protein n=1 Tax=Acetobacter sp. LMG 32666 TaxID=2959295 RepID=UPI0030C81062